MTYSNGYDIILSSNPNKNQRKSTRTKHMIFWMKKGTSDLLDMYKITVFAFDPQRNGDTSPCIVSYGGQEGDFSTTITLGPTKGLADDAIDRRFRAAMLSFAKSYVDSFGEDDDSDRLFALVDTLLH